MFYNNKIRRLIILITFILGLTPSLISDSGLGLIPLDRDSLFYITIRALYEPLGLLGWTDYGSFLFLMVSIVLAVKAITMRKKLSLNWVDYILHTIVLIPAIFLAGSFLFLVYVLSVVTF